MVAQDITRPVLLPVVIGTPRQGRLTEPAANFVFGEISKRRDIETELIDIRKIPLRMDDAGEALKDSQFSATVARADGLILVVPEYNHSFRGLLKHVIVFKPQGIHPQSGRHLRSFSRSVRRRAHDSEPAAGTAGAGPSYNFLGCLFRYRRKALRSCYRQNYGSGLRGTRGQISERARLDVTCPSPRTRKYSGSLTVSRCASAQPRFALYFWISSTLCPSGSLTSAPLEKPTLSFGIATTLDETERTCARCNFCASASRSFVTIVVCQWTKSFA